MPNMSVQSKPATPKDNLKQTRPREGYHPCWWGRTLVSTRFGATDIVAFAGHFYLEEQMPGENRILKYLQEPDKVKNFYPQSCWEKSEFITRQVDAAYASLISAGVLQQMGVNEDTFKTAFHVAASQAVDFTMFYCASRHCPEKFVETFEIVLSWHVTAFVNRIIYVGIRVQ